MDVCSVEKHSGPMIGGMGREWWSPGGSLTWASVLPSICAHQHV